MAKKTKKKELECRRETVPIEKLVAAPYNPRKDLTPSDPEYQRIAKSMERWGHLGGIVWNKTTGYLVGGHQRIKVLKAKGVTEVEVTVVELTDDEEAELNLTLNHVHGMDHMPRLKEVLFELEGKGIDTSAIFDRDRVAAMLHRDQEQTNADDEVPEPPEDPRSKLGDLWEMGDHRLYCGDATKDASAKALGLDVHNPAMIFTDPPYGVSYKARSGKFEVIKGDDARDDELLNNLLAPAFKLAVKYAQDYAAFYVWHASSTREDFVAALKAAGLIERQYLIWAKSGIVLGHSDYRWAHEPCFYASKAEKKPAFYGDRAQPTVWRANLARKGESDTVLGPGIVLLDGKGGAIYITPKIPTTKKVRKIRLGEKETVRIDHLSGSATGDVWEVGKETGYRHPTQKPVELAMRAILNSSKSGEVVYDGFAGSGTTLIGAEKTDRRAYMMELDPKYCDVIVTRWEQFTGRTAVLAE